ncbi:MAG: DUF2203 family protein [Chloroflexi bacterium]|jgi:hypothetical protein|nr:DUF2203 family protein [Chloroflexota bacterium]
MTPRYFTLAEANDLLPQIKPLMAQLLELRAKTARLSQQLGDLLETPYLDFGGPIPNALAQDFIVMETLLNQIRSHGCIVKNLEAGLVDFLAQIDGRDVYLCWRYGEESITYYHELHTGFPGRRPIH